MRALVILALLLAGVAQAQGTGLWWLGMIDANDRAFFEMPPAPGDCAARDLLVRSLGGGAGTLLLSRVPAAREVPADARLTFSVLDLQGGGRERVLTRVAAIVREEESGRPLLAPACWYLAEAGPEGGTYQVLEDRVAIALHPPRQVVVRATEGTWMSFGESPAAPGAAARSAAAAALPDAIRRRLAALLSDADQFHAQPFVAVLDPRRGPESMWLLGAIGRPDGPAAEAATYYTVNQVVRADAAAAPLYQAGPSGGLARDRAGSFVAQVVAALDLDGDGVDELVLRLRYYSGGNLQVLKWTGTRFTVLRQGGYEGE